MAVPRAGDVRQGKGMEWAGRGLCISFLARGMEMDRWKKLWQVVLFSPFSQGKRGCHFPDHLPFSFECIRRSDHVQNFQQAEGVSGKTKILPLVNLLPPSNLLPNVRPSGHAISGPVLLFASIQHARVAIGFGYLVMFLEAPVGPL